MGLKPFVSAVPDVMTSRVQENDEVCVKKDRRRLERRVEHGGVEKGAFPEEIGAYQTRA